MDLDNDISRWLLARFPRPLVIFAILLKVILMSEIFISVYVLLGAGIVVFVLSKLPLWLAILIAITGFLIFIAALFWDDIDKALPKREKKNDE